MPTIEHDGIFITYDSALITLIDLFLICRGVAHVTKYFQDSKSLYPVKEIILMTNDVVDEDFILARDAMEFSELTPCLLLEVHEVAFSVAVHKHGVFFQSHGKAVSLVPPFGLEDCIDHLDLILYKGLAFMVQLRNHVDVKLP